MADKIDSNSVGLRYSEEVDLGEADPAAVWTKLEPNSFPDFGGTVGTVPREPITQTRQRKKGLATTVDATGGFNADLTQEGLPDLAQGFLFADLRTKNELSVATVDGTGEVFEPATGGDAYVAGDLLFAQGFDDAANNGLHEVSGIPAAASIPVSSDLVEAAGQSGTLRRVGFHFTAADAAIDASGSLPKLTTTTKDLTTLGLVPGEWVFLGGDTAATQFATAENNGFARVRSVSANEIVFDKTQNTMATEAAANAVQMFFAPRVLKNESDPSLIMRRTYQLERTLGAPDAALPAQIQSEYLVGAVPNELQFNIATADKVTFDASFIAQDVEYRTAAQGVKAGSRPEVDESEAFNTSSDFKRVRLSKVVDGDAAPTPLFAFAQDISVMVNNNISPNKAVGVFGAFDMTAGFFAVSGSLTAYFGDVAAQAAIRDNEDITLDMHMVKGNQGITLDLPLITLGDGKPSVEANSPITQPFTFEAAAGNKIHENLNHTLLLGWWDYLPDAAEG